MTEKEPRSASHFELKLGDREPIAGFRECTGMDSESEVTERRSTDAKGRPLVRKVPGATKWSDITLKRGVDKAAARALGAEDRKLWT